MKNTETAKEKLRVYRANYYLKNKARMLALNRSWDMANPEKRRQMRRNNYYKNIVTQRAWHQKNREKHNLSVRRGELMRKFGLTLERYEEMRVAQEGLCAICRQPPSPKRKLCVDHCHDSGVVRGLLCILCNAGIGSLKHNKTILESAISYLKKPHG